jgi:hypothetical protein
MRRTRMRLPLAPVLAACALLLAACGTSTNDSGNVAPTTSPLMTPSVAPPVTVVPPAQDPVTGIGTVIEKPDSPPELCLGPVRESWPPQCEGIALIGWDWTANPPDAQSEAGAPVTRWGVYAVDGTFDGDSLTVTRAVSLALYDAMAEPSPTPVAPPDLSAAEWDAVDAAVRAVPGLITVDRVDEAGPLVVTVVYDDGAIQRWADASFGAGAVVVTSALR